MDFSHLHSETVALKILTIEQMCLSKVKKQKSLWISQGLKIKKKRFIRNATKENEKMYRETQVSSFIVCFLSFKTKVLIFNQ